MTTDQFQHKYYDYCVQTKEECIQEIRQMESVISEENGKPIKHLIFPVHFPELGWCLMLDTAYFEMKRLGIV